MEIETDGDVNSGKNGMVFVQSFRLNRKEAPTRQILVTAVARVYMDDKKRELCTTLAENYAKHELPKSCENAKALQLVSRPAFGKVVTLKLMYKHYQREISCKNNDFMILQDQEVCKQGAAGK